MQGVSTDARTATPADRDLLLRLAGPRAFVRGEAYLARGRVRSLHDDGPVLAGVVEGSEPYRVELRREEDGTMVAACTCPHGADGRFCKHAVAVALAGLEAALVGGTAAASSGDPSEEGLRGWLERQPHGTLVDLLAEAATGSAELREGLDARRRADAAGPPPPRLRTTAGHRTTRRW
jgi:uncharacterized Zn finger protein